MKRWISRIGATRTLGLLSLLGIVLGVALFTLAAPLSSSISRAIGYDAPRSTRPPIRPSPTWAPMPTRDRPRPPVTRSENRALNDLRRALLLRDLESARLLWAQGPPPHPPDRVAWYQNGARLFIALGQMERARSLIQTAIVLSPKETDSWLLLYFISRDMQDWQMAGHVLEVTLALDPSQADDLFLDRWLLASRDGNPDGMAVLAESFKIRNLDDSLQAYFSAKALLAAGDTLGATTRLIEALERDPGSSVVLWYTLGEAYLELGAYQEAQSVLETAAERFYEGDRTATHLEAPFLDNLNFNLARAYLGSGACANAEAVFRRLAVSDATQRASETTQSPSGTGQTGASRFDAWIEQSVRCQTPTPTLTPWIPSQQSTPTPAPPQD